MVWPRAKSATCLQCMLLEVDQGKIPPPSSLPPCPHLACLRGCPLPACPAAKRTSFSPLVSSAGVAACRAGSLAACLAAAPAGLPTTQAVLAPTPLPLGSPPAAAVACAGNIKPLLAVQYPNCWGKADPTTCNIDTVDNVEVGGRASRWEGGRGGRACGRQRSPAACLPTPSLTFALSFRVNPAEH